MPRKSKDELKNVKTNIENTVVENITAKVDTDVAKKKTSAKSSKAKKETKTEAKMATKKTTKTTKTAKTVKSETEKTKKSKSDKTKVEKEAKKEAKKVAKKEKAEKTPNKKASSKTTKAATKKATSKTASKKTTKTASSSKKQVIATAEYYDLPYRYNQTVVKILAQTPTMLFIYWDLSDDDRNSYIQKYGESFFNDTKPVLIITNKTMNYTFEVEINDFANSWYLPLNDPDCDYSVELGRKPKYPNYQNTPAPITVTDADGNTVTKQYQPLDNYIYICTSNDMEMPNNHILFDRLGKSVFFKNVKNNFVEEKNISSLSFITNIGKVYNIYDLYKEMYKDEINAEDLSSDSLNLNLSSSGGSSSSSTFK